MMMAVVLLIIAKLVSIFIKYILRSDQKKTKVKKKTSNPQFEETFFFEVNSATIHFAVEPRHRFEMFSYLTIRLVKGRGVQ